MLLHFAVPSVSCPSCRKLLAHVDLNHGPHLDISSIFAAFVVRTAGGPTTVCGQRDPPRLGDAWDAHHSLAE